MGDQRDAYLKHWTMLHFILELLTLKAKYSWSDDSFNDLLCILAWLPPQRANTYRAKKFVSPFTVCGNNQCMSKSLYFVSCRYFQRLWTNVVYVLQVNKKIISVIVVVTIEVQTMGINGRGTLSKSPNPKVLPWLCGTSQSNPKVQTKGCWTNAMVGDERRAMDDELYQVK